MWKVELDVKVEGQSEKVGSQSKSSNKKMNVENHYGGKYKVKVEEWSVRVKSR